MAIADPDPEQLAMRVRRSTMRLRRRLRADAPSGLSQTEFATLSSVIRQGPVGLGELAALEGVKPPSMTRVATALERAGLVTREVDADDRRRARLRATAAGQDLVEANRRLRDARLAGVLSALTAADRFALEQGIDVLEEILEQL